MRTQKNSKTIVVEGPIGIGKSSLADKLATSFDCPLVKEKPNENPFLEDFYTNSQLSALPVQLHFLTERVKQWQHSGTSGLVSDFMPAKDELFAKLTLNEAEYALYQNIYQLLNVNTLTPDLVIYLQAPADTLQARIKKRGLKHEQKISLRYLQKVSDAYTAYFHHYTSSPLLIINASDINPITNDADYEHLLTHINANHSGRRYINPLPSPSV